MTRWDLGAATLKGFVLVVIVLAMIFGARWRVSVNNTRVTQDQALQGNRCQ